MVWDRAARVSKLNARNWECGVLVPAVRPQSPRLQDKTSNLEQVVVTIDDSTTDSEGETSKRTKKPAEKLKAVNTKDEAMERPKSAIKIAAGPVSPPVVKRKAETIKQTVLPMSVFTGVIDVPFEWPAKTYMSGQRPWFFRGDEGGVLED